MDSDGDEVVGVEWDTPLNPSQGVYFRHLIMENNFPDEGFSIGIIVKQMTVEGSQKHYKIGIPVWAGFRTTVEGAFNPNPGCYYKGASCSGFTMFTRKIIGSQWLAENDPFSHLDPPDPHEHYFIGTYDIIIEILTDREPTFTEVSEEDLKAIGIPTN